MAKARPTPAPGTIPLSMPPMEAEPVDELPSDPGWQFEPKYDGFRCVAFRDGADIQLQSRRQKPLQRYFPEVAAACLSLPHSRFVLDGELVIPGQPFDLLQQRLHPAASRVARLSAEHPARLVAFDLLADADAATLLDRPLSERRAALERWFAAIGDTPRLALSRVTGSVATARGWLDQLGFGLDGVMAKRLDQPYRPGERAMRKFKVWQTVDCVLGGLYMRADGNGVEYLLLGLYDGDGLLHYVGRCTPPDPDTWPRLRALIGGAGFTGRAPGGTSRWSTRERKAVPLRPILVVEVSADHVEAGRFRHGSRLLRWRDDKPAEACTMAQIERRQAPVGSASTSGPVT